MSWLTDETAKILVFEILEHIPYQQANDTNLVYNKPWLFMSQVEVWKVVVMMVGIMRVLTMMM